MLVLVHVSECEFLSFRYWVLLMLGGCLDSGCIYIYIYIHVYTYIYIDVSAHRV